MKNTTEYEIWYFNSNKKNTLWTRTKDYAMALQAIEEIKNRNNEPKVIYILEVKKKVITEVIL